MTEAIIWQSYDNIDIREISYEDIDNIVTFVINCQLEDNIMMNMISNQKDDMHKIYSDFYKYVLNRRESLIAINRETNKLIGVIVCLIMTDYMRSWVDLMLKITNPSLKIILNFNLTMLKEAHKLQEQSGSSMDSVHVFSIAVPNNNKGFNWKPRLLNAVIKMTKCLKMPCVTYLAFTLNNQIRAQRAGMKEQFRIYYNHYVDQEFGIRPFRLMKIDELCAILYRRDVDPAIPYNEIKETYDIPKRIKSSRRYYKNAGEKS